MFSKIFQKLQSFEAHHQIFFAVLAAVGVIFCTWGIEKTLEYFLDEKKLLGFISAIIIGLAILWLTKYTILEIM